MSVKLLTEHNLEVLSLNGGCTGSSESTLVKMPHCWKSHVMAQSYIFYNGSHRLKESFCDHGSVCCMFFHHLINNLLQTISPPKPLGGISPDSLDSTMILWWLLKDSHS